MLQCNRTAQARTVLGRTIHDALGTDLSVLEAAAAFGLTSAAMRAAPVAGLSDRTIGDEQPAIEQIAYRRCWWRNGKKHCHRFRGNRPRVHRYPYGSGGQETNLPPNLGW
jgi:hypothetical protein